MNILRHHCRPIAVLAMACFMAASLFVPAANARLVPTERTVAADTQTQREKVTAFMQREDVRAQMESLGVSPAEAEARVAALSDAEINRIAGKIDELPAGQDFLGALLGVAVVVFIVLLITDILGFTHVFGFTNKGSANP